MFRSHFVGQSARNAATANRTCWTGFPPTSAGPRPAEGPSPAVQQPPPYRTYHVPQIAACAWSQAGHRIARTPSNHLRPNAQRPPRRRALIALADRPGSITNDGALAQVFGIAPPGPGADTGLLVW